VAEDADPWLRYFNGNYYLITMTFTGNLGMRKSPTLAGPANAPNEQVWSDSTPARASNSWGRAHRIQPLPHELAHRRERAAHMPPSVIAT
jgi:hypothetical protein